MKKQQLYHIVLTLAAGGYFWLGWNVTEYSGGSSTPDFCLVKQLTGYPCPSCGTTRSLVELTEGHFSRAFVLNPLGYLAAAMLAVIPLWIAFDLLLRKETFYRFYRSAENIIAQRKWISIPAVLLLILNWGWNISKGL